jgi:hypothetical protein
MSVTKMLSPTLAVELLNKLRDTLVRGVFKSGRHKDAYLLLAKALRIFL